MIKAETTLISKGGHTEANTEVTMNGTGKEILHEFVGIVMSMRSDCPELLIEALRNCKEELE